VGPEVLIFMFSMNCPLDFDSELWSGFGSAMSEEWNITATTSCHEVTEFPSSLHEYKSTAKSILMERDANFTAVAERAGGFTTYIDSILE
jgi:hypothetical protein